MKTFLKFAFLFLVFCFLFALPAAIFPVSVQYTNSPINSIFVLLVMITDFIAILFLLKRLKLRGTRLFLSALLIIWGLQTFMTQTETWYFRKAMPALSNQELINFFIRPLFSMLVFIPIAMQVFGKWKNDQEPVHFNLKPYRKRIAVLSVLYVIIYFGFGYFIAWQFEAVRMFYSGTPEKLSFLEQLKITIHNTPSILIFQLLRGALWVIIGLPLLLNLMGGRTEKILACVLFYSIFPSIPLILENPFMPEGVRIAHFLEVSLSNGLYGFLIGLIFVPDPVKKNGVVV